MRSNGQCLFAVGTQNSSIEVELELEGRTVELVELLEGVEAARVFAGLGIERILAPVEFGSLLLVRENLLRRCDVEEFLFRLFLLVRVLKIVGMPLLSGFSVSLHDFPFRRSSRYTENLVVVPALGDLLTLLGFLKEFLRPLITLIDF